MKQAHIYYSGIVQGVGFRYTVQRYARDLKLTGWVRNLNDGRVEILTQGPEATIQKFLDAVDRHFEGSIKNKCVEFVPAAETFRDFQIVA